MTEKTHKHKGVLISDGNLRSHPISRNHSDIIVQREHNKIEGFISKDESKKKVDVIFNKGVVCPVDKDGFIYVDLTTKDMNQKGVRVKVVRYEFGHKKTVGIEIIK